MAADHTDLVLEKTGYCQYCDHVCHPPFLVDWSQGQPQPNSAWWKSNADYRHIQDAPQEAKLLYVRTRHREEGVCSWFDTANQCCKYYDHRPETCREAEINNSSLSELSP